MSGKVDYENPWLYNDEPFTSENIGEYIGFVYMITHINSNRKYVGKKLFVSKTKLPPLKGYTRKRTVYKESDWKKYYSSSEELKLLKESHKDDIFKREILHLCNNKGEMSYLEAKEQFERNVLLSDEYINGIINCKIHRSHVKHLIRG